jgi:DNA helicase HerA-like ATPase
MKTSTAAADASRRFAEELDHVARKSPPIKADPAVIGRTTFDTPGSEDLTLTVLLSEERVQVAPSQSLVRIISKEKRKYLGVVEAGPFAEPDSLRADSPILTAVATQQADYVPRYHGRLQVKLLGEELEGGALSPPRLRPLPHSPVYLLKEDETATVLKCGGDVRLGLAVGHEGLVVGVPSTSKNILPRHTAILGTTGGGKSTTVSVLVRQAAAAGMAVIVLDVEGEYTHLHQANDDKRFLPLLKERGIRPEGVPVERMGLYHLVGRETTNPTHPNRQAFSLQFARLSPYAAMAMMDCNEAQGDRFLFAYEVAKSLMRELGIFPKKGVTAEEAARQERFVERLDEFERGYPRLTLSFLLDVVEACKARASKGQKEPFNEALKSTEGRAALKRAVDSRDAPGNVASWGKVQSLLYRLNRLRVFDTRAGGARPLAYRDMLKPGRVSVVDLSDAGLSELSNIAVADVLRGIQEEQDRAYREHEAGKGEAPPRVLLVLEEAHEFLGADRVRETPHLYEQIGRLAKRGRKRWLGLCLVTQLPQHLPRQVLSMCNNYVLHKITDPQVVLALRHTVSGVDDSLWARLPGLTPGQAVVSFGHMARPVLASIDPPAAKLRMVD